MRDPGSFFGAVCAMLVPLIVISAAGAVHAQSFDAQISPPRFTIKAQPGERVRESLRIVNGADAVGRYAARTADWTMSDKGDVAFNEGTPAADSCRPWVLLERREFTVAPKVSRSFRFEVEIPKDAAPTECRFAIMIGADPKTLKPVTMGQIAIPVSGQIAVVVYIAIAGAKPQLQVLELRPGKSNGLAMPVAIVRNSGTAHGRIEGVLRGRDPTGKEFDLQASSVPIMPGMTREIPIIPLTEESKPTAVSFPFSLRGKIEWDGGSHPVDATVN